MMKIECFFRNLTLFISALPSSSLPTVQLEEDAGREYDLRIQIVIRLGIQ